LGNGQKDWGQGRIAFASFDSCLGYWREALKALGCWQENKNKAQQSYSCIAMRMVLATAIFHASTQLSQLLKIIFLNMAIDRQYRTD
jgi:hypothetical protein